MFSAYTIRKILPRLLIAVIAIQLSWSLVLLAVRLNNDVAHGLEALFYAPFGGIKSFDLGAIVTGNGGSAAAFTGSFFGLAAAGTIGFLTLGPGTLVGVLALAGTAALGLLVALFTLILRRAVLLFLIVIAPLAIVAWVLPGTDKFWKLWWESFSKLLIMYPLILLMIAAGRVFARVAAAAGSTSNTPGAALLTFGMIVLGFFGPLFLIPATLKLAGTAFATITGAVNNKGKGAFDRLRGVRGNEAKKNSTRHLDHAGRRITSRRNDIYQNWQKNASNMEGMNAAQRRLYGFGAKRIRGYNLQAEHSAQQAKVSKEIEDIIKTGPDDEIRGLTVNKLTSQSRIKDGIKQYQTLGGSWVSEAAVDAGHKRWGHDRYAQQAALSYEMRKASTSEEVEGIGQNYTKLAMGQGGWGMSKNQASNALIGAGFENQHQHLEFKNMSVDDKNPLGALKLDGAKLATEASEKKGAHALSQYSGHTFEQLGAAWKEAEASKDIVTMQKLQSVAKTYMTEYGGAGGPMVTPEGEPLAPATPGTPATSSLQANIYGAGAVQQKAVQFAQLVGAYQPQAMPTPKSTGPPPIIPPQK